MKKQPQAIPVRRKQHYPKKTEQLVLPADAIPFDRLIAILTEGERTVPKRIDIRRKARFR